MNLSKLNIEQLVELRTKMILEKSNIDEINRIIDQKEEEYSQSIIEDTGSVAFSGGVSMANASIPGAGPVIAAQPSSLAGSTIGADYTNGGGRDGSGDIGVAFNATGGNIMSQKIPTKEMGTNHGPRTGKKSRQKKLNLKTLKNIFAQRQDFTADQGGVSKKRVMNFDDFQKDDVNKINKVKY